MQLDKFTCVGMFMTACSYKLVLPACWPICSYVLPACLPAMFVVSPLRVGNMSSFICHVYSRPRLALACL